MKDSGLQIFPGVRNTHLIVRARLVCFSTTCCFEKSVLAGHLSLMQILYHITWQQTGKLKRLCSEEFGLVEVLKGEQLLKRD